MDLKNSHLMGLEAIKARNKFATFLKILLFPTIIYFIFILGYFEIINLKVEAHSIILMGLIYIVSIVFAFHNAEFSYCVLANQIDDFRTNLKQYILKNLLKIGEDTKSNASFKDFFNEYIDVIKNENYSSVANGIFPTLGILGTFISIAITMPNFNSQNASALEQEISVLLSGVGTAFYVSIYGMFLLLWWIYFERRGYSKIDRLSEKLKLSTQDFFWTKEEIEQGYLQENLLHFEKIGKMFSKMSGGSFFEELNASIDDKFSLFKKILKLEEDAALMNKEHLQKGMQAISSANEKQHDIVRLNENITKELKTFNEQFIHLSHDITKTQEIFQEKISKLSSNINDFASIFEINNQKLILTLEEFSTNLLKNQDKMLKTFAQSVVEGVSVFKNELINENVENISIEELEKNLKEMDKETSEIIKKLDFVNNNEK